MHPLLFASRLDVDREDLHDFGNIRAVPVAIAIAVTEADITDGTTVNLGNPDGPPVSFEVGRHQGAAGRPPQTSTVVAGMEKGMPTISIFEVTR